MDPRLARLLIAVSLAAGMAADLLFDRVGPGINVPVAVAAGLAVTWWFRPRATRVDRLDWWIPPVTLAAALGVALRSDVALMVANVALAGVGLLAWALAVSVGSLTRRSAVSIAALGTEAAILVAVGAGFAGARAVADRPAAGAGRAWRRALPVARGLVVAVPVVAVFAALLGSADAAFAGMLDDLLDLGLDLDELIRRGAFTLLLAWLVAGGLWVAGVGLPGVLTELLPGPPGPVAAELPLGGPPSRVGPAHERGWGTRGWGTTEALTVLVAVEVLFGAFIAVQVAYLFGGFDALTRTGMTYSDYAREGFFQLVAVVAGAGMLLLAGHALAGRSRWFVPVALGLVALTALILVSAAVRLGLYQQAYGWTELRFYVVVAIAWFGVDLLLAGGLVVLRRAAWLVHGVTAAGVAVLLAATLIGPSAFIARQNVERVLDPSLVPHNGRAGLDADYVLTLGDGAVPVLVDALPNLPEVERAAILQGLERRRAELETPGPMLEPAAWNLERQQARDALATVPARP